MKHFLKRRAAGCLALLLGFMLLAGCGAQPPRIYSVTYLDVFDTVTTVMGTAESEQAFSDQARRIHDELLRYHQLFDIYNDYDGIANLKTVNDSAGLAPVAVDPAVLALLRDCRAAYDATDGTVNAAMGSVLSLWHDAREAGLADPEHARLPDPAALEEASRHTSMDDVILDEAAGTVFLADPALRLDVGAVAKGWAAERAAETAPEGFLLSVGGNVRATGPKYADGTPWVVGVQNPDTMGDSYLATLPLTEGSMVTSGDYQRFFTVSGVRYHHIIDPATQMPAALWRSVTIVCADSGLADVLSTALFLMPREEGQALLDRFDAEALWVAPDGSLIASSGFPASVQNG